MEPFEAGLADSLRLYYNLDDEQIKAYGHALGDMHDINDPVLELSYSQTIDFMHERERKFLEAVPEILPDEQYSLWKRDWDDSYPRTMALMAYNCYAKHRGVLFRDLQGMERQTGIYWTEDRYSEVLADFLDVDLPSAKKLLIEEHMKREYISKREIRMWGISDDQAIKLALCEYEHEHRLYEIEKKEVSGYLKDILRQREDEIYSQSIIDVLGYDFYCAWSDYNEVGSSRYEVSEDKLDELKKIQKQMETDRVKINRGMPELSDQQRRQLLDAAGKKKDAAMEKLRNRR